MRRVMLVVCLMGLLMAPGFAQIQKTSPAAAGVTILVPELLMFNNTEQNRGNWEPYSSACGDGTLLFVANTEATGPEPTTERAVVAFFKPDNSVLEVPGFYSQVAPPVPWNSNNDTARTDGNPPRIAGDKRPGATKYLLGNECTPYSFVPDVFPTWGAGFEYTNTVGCVQLLNKTDAGPVPIGPVIDPSYGTTSTGGQAGAIRFGGEIRGLSNGNFICVVEDRSGAFPGNNGNIPLGSIIDGNTGLRIGEPFSCNLYDPSHADIWGGVAAFNGGFAVKPDTGASNSSISFFDNAGAAQGMWERITRTEPSDPLPPAEGFESNSSISDTGRGDGFRIDSDIRSNFIYYAGRGIDSPTGTPSKGVYITKINALTRQTVKEVYVTEGLNADPDRVNICVDELENVFVCWNDRSNTLLYQIAGRFYNNNLEPLSDVFLVFGSSEPGPEPVTQFNVFAPSCAMINGRCLVTCRLGDSAVVEPPLTYLAQDQLATVLEIPGQTTVKNWEKY